MAESLLKLGLQAKKEANLEQAKDYLEQAGKLNCHMAFFWIGYMYYQGQLPQDYAKAKEYFQKAIDLNDPEALHYVGCIYRNGNTQFRDRELGKQYIEKAAELKYPDALRALGRMYLYSEDVEPDYVKSKQYFEEAIKMYQLNLPNDITSLINLSEMYFDGNGLDKPNFSMAISLRIQAYQISKDEHQIDRLAYIIASGPIELKKNFVNMYIDQLNTCEEQKQKITQLESENKHLQAQLDYRPDGPGYQQAKDDWQLLTKKGRN